MVDYNKLDKLLEELYNGDGEYAVPIGETYYTLFKPQDKHSGEYRKYMAELKGLGLAREVEGSGTFMEITSLGREVYKSGGWVKYKTHKEGVEKEEKELRLREVNATEDSAISSKSSKQAAWVSAFLAFIAAAIAGLQYFDSKGKDDSISQLEKRIARLDSLQQIQEKTRLLLDSSALPVDSSESHQVKK